MGQLPDTACRAALYRFALPPLAPTSELTRTGSVVRRSERVRRDQPTASMLAAGCCGRASSVASSSSTRLLAGGSV